MKSKKLILVLILITITIPYEQLCAQITVGSELPPEKAALIDIKTVDGGNEGKITTDKGGILLPRVEITDMLKLTVFPDIKETPADEYEKQKKRHIGLTVFNLKEDAEKGLAKGVYVWNGNMWERSSYKSGTNFFYMPSIEINTKQTGTLLEVNLYEKYKDQFKNPKVKSEEATDTIPYLKADEIYYYITDYDENIFDETSFSISKTGLMKYKVTNAPIDGTSYINIVFVVKH